MTERQARAELLAGAGTPVRRARGGGAAPGAGARRAPLRPAVSAGQVVRPAALHAARAGARRHASIARRALRGVAASAASSTQASAPRSRSSSANTVPPSTQASRAAGGNRGRPPSRSRRAIAARMCGHLAREVGGRALAQPGRSSRSGGSVAGENGGGSEGLLAPTTRWAYSWRGERISASREPGTPEARRSSAAGASTWISSRAEEAGEVAPARGRGDQPRQREPRARRGPASAGAGG